VRKLRDFRPASIYERAVTNPSNPRRQTLVAVGAASLVAALAAPAGAQPKSAPAETNAAQAIERALQRHGGDVHACFARVLADRLDSAGKVEVAVEVGKGGKVKSAKVGKVDKTAGPGLAECIEKAALGWTMEGIEPGAKVVLPFAFKAQTAQFIVQGTDVPERALGAPPSNKAKAGPKRDVPFTVKVLADEQNVKAEGLSLTLLSIGPASRVAMHRHPHSAKILYLVKGHARLLGPEGTPPVKLEEGAAAFVPAGYPHVIENMGRQSTAVFLQAFSPPGPERVYRDPTDARGRAEFEVIRDAASAKEPGEKVVVAAPSEAKPATLPKNGGTVKNLVQGAGMSLALYELADGAELQGAAGGGTEAFFVVAGAGQVKAGAESAALATETVVYLPRGTAYAFKLALPEKADKVTLVKLSVARPGAVAPRR
jgi:mannose-6-phosphate isomerase-like protein (cupin superfamily)